jgi:hypothetical protein
MAGPKKTPAGAETQSAAPKEATQNEAAPQGQPVNWNTSALHSSYANFCNANSTREEVVLNFGVNKSWDRSRQSIEIELNHRIVMSPYAAKRLAELMQKLIGEYEVRYGPLSE